MFDIIQNALTFGRNSAFDSANKEKWWTFGTGVLQRLSKDLAIPVGTFSIHTCKGGNAAAGKFCPGAVDGKCSCKGGSALLGEIILQHTDGLYVCLSASSKKNAGYVRIGDGTSRPIPESYEGLSVLCLEMLQEAEDNSFADMLTGAAQ